MLRQHACGSSALRTHLSQVYQDIFIRRRYQRHRCRGKKIQRQIQQLSVAEVCLQKELQSCDKKCEVVGGAGGGDQRRKAQQLAHPQPRLINLPACLLLLWPRLEEAAERTGVQ